MALLIEKELDILGGLTANQLYLRFSYKLDFNGKDVLVNVKKYANKNAYSSENPNEGLDIKGIPNSMFITYDRNVDGLDVLSFIHNKFKEELSTDKTNEVAVIDPSTGLPLLDPSTGEIMTETIIVSEKFAEENEISVIDISIG